MAKPTKATKKFEKNKLKSTLDHRKEFAKIKQRHQVKVKKKQKTAKKSRREGPEDDGKVQEAEEVEEEDMNNDQFFREQVQIPGETAKKTKKTTSTHIGKRKRDAEETEELTEEPDFDDGKGVEEDDLYDHKGQLEGLAEKDPEFYKYLQENDAELLDFNEDGDLAEVDTLSQSDDDERPAKKSKKQATSRAEDRQSERLVVTTAMLDKWKTSMSEQYSVRALRQVVLAFRAVAHANDTNEKDYRYTVPDSDTYHEILTIGLKNVPPVLRHHLPVKESTSGKVRVSTDSPKFKTLSPLIKSHASSLHHLLGNLSDPAALKLTLQCFEPLLPYLLQFRKFLKLIVKSIASIWSDNSTDESTRITAFLNIRRLVIVGDAGIRDTVLKSTYEGIVKGSRNTTSHTLPGINLMKNSAAEIWGIDQKVSYTTAFTYLRQLAIHLRSNITKPTKDSYKSIYNWQFVHSLDFWSRVVSTHCNSLLEAQNGKESQLRPLIYPIVQITLGVMRLIPISTYFPLRFLLMRSLLRISQSTGTYIPLASALLEVLNSAEIKKAPKAASIRPLDFACNIRCPASYLKTRVYQEGVGEQVVELLSEFFVLRAKSIAYPELQLPVMVMLKRWLRTASSKVNGNKNAKVNQALLLLVQKSEANARWVEERRNKVTFSPKDRAEVDTFLKDVSWEETPLGAFVVGQRKLRDERAKVLEQGRQEEDRKRKERKANDDDMDL